MSDKDISISGIGSSWVATETIRSEISILLKKFNIKMLLDLPCGDYHWMQLVDLDGIIYTGADKQSKGIEDNKQKYPSVHFEVLDITQDLLPKNDLVLVRDCLVHLDNECVWKAIDNLKRSRSKYLLITNFPKINHALLNYNIETGGWRPINFQLAPFHFPPPIETIVENCKEEPWVDKSLSLWKIKSLPQCIYQGA
jgi:hypothetical protein